MYLNESRQKIGEQFGCWRTEFPQIYDEIWTKLEVLKKEVALAMKYLYATMPCSDMGNYHFEIFLDYAIHGVKLYEEFETVRKLPEDMYLNYILYHRVNEEEITPCRSFFYEKLKSRVEKISVKEAVLEVNYWCAEEVSYQSTDERTLSPMGVYRRGSGRCGEESVFLVSALRSVGIPARQVYAPRWSHCDDNHAWVEVWCDGRWYFTGACEPSSILNKGWFTNASSRAMMVHSHWFDFMPSSEEIIGKSGMVTMLNELPRYASTKEIEVCVMDETGKPVSGAEVDLEVLNYAEFSPIAQCMTDEGGFVRVTTGLGSLHVYVQKEEVWAEGYLDTRESERCVIVLKNQEPQEMWRAVDMVAPVDTPVNTDMPTGEQKVIGDQKLAQADRQRLEKVSQWTNLERDAFLEKGSGDRGLRNSLLLALTDKDQSDLQSDVMEEHFTLSLPFREEYNPDIFVKYVMNPRVHDEVLTMYRKQIHATFSTKDREDFCENPKKLWSWIEANIRTCSEKEKAGLITTPTACLWLRCGSTLSKKVLFVAVARTFGLAARLNPQYADVEYWAKGRFVPVVEGVKRSAHLTLIGPAVTDSEGTDWTYFQNWTIAKRVEGKYVSLKLSSVSWQEGRLNLDLDSGCYRILTTNRLLNGNQFLNVYEFYIGEGDCKQIKLLLRKADLSDMLEEIDLPEFYLQSDEGMSVKASTLTDNDKTVLFWLEESKEPTEHILNELLERGEDFMQFADRLVLIVRSREALDNPALSQALKLFSNIQVFYDDFKENINTLGRRMYVDHEKLPLIIVTKGKLNGIYGASGYNVGIGDMLFRLLKL